MQRLEGLDGLESTSTFQGRAGARQCGVNSRRGHGGSIPNGRYTFGVIGPLEAYGATDAGPRSTNEDACLVDAPAGLFVVADGMGGHNAGEVASAMAVKEIARIVAEARQRGADVLADAVRAANARILAEANERPECAGMGTTVTAILVDGNRASVVSVGDSRLYLLRAGRLEQLTRDDSWVRQLEDDGSPLSPEDLQRHPMRHVLTEVVGVRPDLEAAVTVEDLRTGDVLLLSSDGLHGVLPAEDLAAELRATASAGVLAEQLVRRAVAGGATDNVTALVVRVT